MAWMSRVAVGGLGLCLLLGLGVDVGVGAEQRPLTGHEIFELLGGNTAVGTTGGTAFRQYFFPDGRTIWWMEDGEPNNGRWRLSEEGEYCVLFRFGDWACYAVTAEGDAVTWVREGNRPFPARIVKGRQLHFD